MSLPANSGGVLGAISNSPARAAPPAAGQTGRGRQAETAMRPLEFGWYLPSNGDTTNYAQGHDAIPAGTPMFARVGAPAGAAGFEYMLVPVAVPCWEAWVTTAFMAGRSSRIRMLVAARPGYINPVMLAQMVTTFA